MIICGGRMKQIEISQHRLSELESKEFECHKLRKRFMHLDKDTQELLLKVERYEQALNILAWKFGCVSVESMRMRDIAKKALYNK